MPECPTCGGPSQPARAGGAELLECRSCGVGRLVGRSDRNDYWDAQGELEAIDDFWIKAKRRHFDAALSLIEPLTRGRRLLDVGGGVGVFAEIAAGRGWEAHTADISAVANERARVRLGADRVHEVLAEVDPASFDVATMWCVVAHTKDHADLLREVRRVLRPDGVLFLTTPNYRFQKLYSRLRASVGYALDFRGEDHVVHFTAAGLRIALDEGGFDDVRFVYAGITEHCVGTPSNARVLLLAKRAWNRNAAILSRLGAGHAMSELQVTARAR